MGVFRVILFCLMLGYVISGPGRMVRAPFPTEITLGLDRLCWVPSSPAALRIQQLF